MTLIGYLDVQAYEKKTTPHWIYDLGRKRNFAQVSLYWILFCWNISELLTSPHQLKLLG